MLSNARPYDLLTRNLRADYNKSFKNVIFGAISRIVKILFMGKPGNLAVLSRHGSSPCHQGLLRNEKQIADLEI